MTSSLLPTSVQAFSAVPWEQIHVAYWNAQQESISALRCQPRECAS